MHTSGQAFIVSTVSAESALLQIDVAITLSFADVVLGLQHHDGSFEEGLAGFTGIDAVVYAARDIVANRA